jgi:hypothetical protein
VTATPDSWKREPFGTGTPIPYHAEFSLEEYEKLRMGLRPRAMEDKWYVYFQEPHLFFHRSWTGQPVYRITLADSKSSVVVTEALCSFAPPDLSDPQYQATLLDFLISNLLLGKSKPFPIPKGYSEPVNGLLQHHIAGTGYPQQGDKTNKRWWALWQRGS